MRDKRVVKGICVFLFTLLIMASLQVAMADAAVYYIAQTGSDSNSGTISSPWKTLTKAAGAIAGGDIIYVRAGTYTGTGYRNISLPSGSAGAYTTVQGYPGDAMPVIDASGGTANGIGVFTVDANFVKILNLHIKGAGAGELGAITIGNQSAASYVVIDGNIIEGSNVGGNVDTNNASGIRVSYEAAAANITISNNEIYGNYMRGIILNTTANHASYVTISNNYIHDVSMGVNNKWSNAGTNSHIVIKYNRIYNMVSPHAAALALDADYMTIQHNILDTGTIGIWFGDNWQGKHCTVSHNTIYGFTKSVYVSTAGGGNTFTDNIRYNTSTIESYGVANTYSDFTSNPSFTNATNHNFTLQTGSGAIGTASDGKNYGANVSLVGPNAGKKPTAPVLQ